MSVAGVRSNRGDVYQNLIGLDWIIRLQPDRSIASVEIDATASAGGAGLLVDDVVVTHADGTKVLCQCKKNEPDFKA